MLRIHIRFGLHQVADGLLLCRVTIGARRCVLLHFRTDFRQHTDHHRVIADFIDAAAIAFIGQGIERAEGQADILVKFGVCLPDFAQLRGGGFSIKFRCTVNQRRGDLRILADDETHLVVGDPLAVRRFHKRLHARVCFEFFPVEAFGLYLWGVVISSFWRRVAATHAFFKERVIFRQFAG
ncbi:Uncharacterised protein [Klebsiella pneumoniae]|uniref:Uncharacterized protein n=1 Tax=Klebsiella pneumoniae TaxID=573 RepID=A0A2X3IVT4_KLEPN|nr:Uncharacterised protein [Klebsiella pneumoniae]